MKNIAIIAGGFSREYDVSINSANVVKKHLSSKKYNIYVIIIQKNEWYYKGENNQCYHIDKNNFSLTINSKIVQFDAVFNAIHGTPGEDGILQAYFDLVKIPYTSCDLMTSALTFNKSFCKKIVASFGVKTPPMVHLYKRDTYSTADIIKKLDLPLFVKPNAAGSSVGVNKADSNETLKKAIKLAFDEDDEVLVEKYIQGREITCGVFDFKGRMMVFPITEIITKNEFFDYEAKYTPGFSNEITPANLPEEIEIECKTTSANLFQRLNCKGVVRFDYICDESGLWFLEVNTVPGLSEASIIPQQAIKFGLSLSELFEMMIESVLH